ncbi:hypothetical protein C8F04DRAFT_263177 [Mycena alexandri]|uniref:Amidase domain-containing protein n=1 Tax=Mycena alexandri TaxID=1745969 RepID=A0AAD6WQQ5_9AGAR|nr:hypothetical protein C8F04DRAFT_263177 [Mycena alexandri]
MGPEYKLFSTGWVNLLVVLTGLYFLVLPFTCSMESALTRCLAPESLSAVRAGKILLFLFTIDLRITFSLMFHIIFLSRTQVHAAALALASAVILFSWLSHLSFSHSLSGFCALQKASAALRCFRNRSLKRRARCLDERCPQINNGTCRELERTDTLTFSLLATTPFPGLQAPQVQQLMNILRCFLFDLQNSVYELVPNGGPDQMLLNMVFIGNTPRASGLSLPISIKDHMDLAGHKSAFGFSGGILNPPASKHGTITQVFYDAGAVFYCKTNLPKSVMHLETHSFWGEVVNPFNTSLTPGGS